MRRHAPAQELREISMSAFQRLHVRGRSAIRILAMMSATLMASIGLVTSGIGASAAPATLATAANGPVPGHRGEPGVCASCQPPLLYHSGPVLGTPTQPGSVT